MQTGEGWKRKETWEGGRRSLGLALEGESTLQTGRFEIGGDAYEDSKRNERSAGKSQQSQSGRKRGLLNRLEDMDQEADFRNQMNQEETFSRKSEDESNIGTSIAMQQEAINNARAGAGIKVIPTPTAEQQTPTNFKLIRHFQTTEDSNTPRYTLEVRHSSPKRFLDISLGKEQQGRQMGMSNQPIMRVPVPLNTAPITPPQITQATHLRKLLLQKKKEIPYVPPPEFFKKRKLMKNINFVQWKAQSVLRYLPPKEKQDDQKLEDLDDFTSLLTKRLLENLDEAEATHGNYTVKEGSYCLIIQSEKPERRRDDFTKYNDKKVRSFDEMLPGPCFGLSRLEDKRGSFNKDEIQKFEQQYKDVLYDTRIKIGRFYQAFTPERKACRAFLKSTIIYGLPPKNSHLIKPPKLVIEYKNKTRQREKDLKQQNPDNQMLREDLEDVDNDEKQEEHQSYIRDDDFVGEVVREHIYVPRRALSQFLEWNPELVKDPEVEDMMSQVMDEFKGDSRMTKEILYDYLKLCKLNKERFLDHLEMDHDDFRKYVFMAFHHAS